MIQLAYGVDVSHYQSPAQVRALKGQVDFVIVKLSEGKSIIDDRGIEHVKAAREIGAAVGAYHFFHFGEPVAQQVDVFLVAAERAGYGRDGVDIIPALDVENYGDRVVTPAWSDDAEAATMRLVAEFGDAMPYISHYGWKCLGSPAWVCERPLWVPHYDRIRKPATPGDRPATIWQHRSAPFVQNGPAGDFEPRNPESIDQNRALLELPRVKRRDTAPITDAVRERVLGQVAQAIDNAVRATEPERLG